MWPMFLGLLVSTLMSSALAFSSPMMMPFDLSGIDPKSCPAPMSNFDLSEFLGEWYLLEYEFATEPRLTPLDCLSFKFTIDDVGMGSDMSVLTSNFTFRFPPKSGFKYNVPTFGIFDTDSNAKWTTNFKKVEMVTVVVDTDYSRWAVLAQCVKNSSGEPIFQSSRILSRSRSLSSADLDRARAAIREDGVEGPFKHAIDQENC